MDELARRVRELIEDPVTAARLGATAAVAGRQRFSMEHSVRDWDALLQRAVGERPVAVRARDLR